MLRYPVTLVPDDNDTLLVSFPDFPEAHTFGEDEVEALSRAVDVLATVMEAYIRDRRRIPAPSAMTSGSVVTLPALTGLKIELYESLFAAGVGKAALAKRLQWHLPQVDRLLDLRHASRLDQLEIAFHAIGKQMVVAVTDERQPDPLLIKVNRQIIGKLFHAGTPTDRVTMARQAEPGHLITPSQAGRGRSRQSSATFRTSKSR